MLVTSDIWYVGIFNFSEYLLCDHIAMVVYKQSRKDAYNIVKAMFLYM